MSFDYHVSWHIDITADSPNDAARLAREIQLDPTSIDTVFEVQEQKDGLPIFAGFTVDLQKLDRLEKR